MRNLLLYLSHMCIVSSVKRCASTAGSGPQGTVSAGFDLWCLLFMLIQIYAVIFTLLVAQTCYKVDSAALEVCCDQRFYLIYKAVRKTIAFQKV